MPVSMNIQLTLTAILSVRDGMNAGMCVRGPDFCAEICRVSELLLWGIHVPIQRHTGTHGGSTVGDRVLLGTQENSGAEGLFLFKVRVEKVSQER